MLLRQLSTWWAARKTLRARVTALEKTQKLLLGQINSLQVRVGAKPKPSEPLGPPISPPVVPEVEVDLVAFKESRRR